MLVSARTPKTAFVLPRGRLRGVLAGLGVGCGACGGAPLPWAEPVEIVAGQLPPGPAAPPSPALHVEVPEGWGRADSTDAPKACADLQVALTVAHDDASGRAEPFVAHADAVLWQVYRAALEALLPSLRDDLRTMGPGVEPACATAHRDLVERAATCVDMETPCDLAPRFEVASGASMSSPALPPFDATCALAWGRDVNGELAAVALESAEVAIGYLDLAWVHWVERVAALGKLRDASQSICEQPAPRFGPDAQADLDALVAALDSPAGDAGLWRIHALDAPSTTNTARCLAEFESNAQSVAARVEDGVRTWAARVRGSAARVEETFSPPRRDGIVEVAGV